VLRHLVYYIENNLTEIPNKIIHSSAVLTETGWVDPGFVQITGRVIAKIQPGKPSTSQLIQADEVIDASNCAVLPGLTNAHTHFSQTFMRGLAGGRSLIHWLKEVVWPIQGVISPEEMYLASLLGMVENLHCGAIWVTDHHKITSTAAHTDAVLKAASEVGLWLTLARSWSDLGKNPETPDHILDDLGRLFDQSKDDDQIAIANGPLALWRCSAETLHKTRTLALEHDAVTHFHVSESLDEIQMSLDQYGKRPVEWLDSIGILGTDTQIVHAVWVDDVEIDLITKTNAPVIHCPVSNAVMGSGVAPVAKMLSQGIDLRLGTDGPASNDTQDIWETLKMAVCCGRVFTQNPTVLPPSEALRLATGGKSIQVGQSADLIIVDLNHPRVIPVQDVDSALVLGTHGSDVQTVIVGGKIMMRDGRITILDEAALYQECRSAIKSLRSRAGITT
jgi:5-methylthioadenosine/S-adenosylhomocysteine deaminase